MSNAIESYSTLNLNPFLLAPLLVSFFGRLDEKENSLLLSYLVFPLVLPPESRKSLANSTKKSSLRTFLKNREALFGVHSRIESYRLLTNECIQHANDLGNIEIKDNFSITVRKPMETHLCPQEALNATKNLAAIFRPFSVVEVYRSLGIKKL